MNFNEPYLAYKQLVKAREKAKNFKVRTFKDRILNLKRSNPKTGGWFISPNGSPDNTGRRFDQPIDFETFRKIIPEEYDRFYFERGQVYNFAEYDIAVNNLTFSSYGSGADPIFLGSDYLGGATWTSETGGYYSTPLATAPLWVTINGECARQGESDWIPVTATPANNQRTFLAATLDAFNSVESLVGVKARFKEFDFRMSWEYTATAYSSGTLTFSIDVIGAAPDLPMKLHGQKQFATLEGDWWYDTANAELWIKTASDPTGTDIRVITEHNCFDLNAVTGTVITGIDITQYYRSAINGYNLGTTTLNVDIHDIRSNGMWLYGNSTGITANGNIFRCGMNGIFMGAVHTSTFNMSIHDIGEQDNYPWPLNSESYWSKTTGCAIGCSPDPNETITLASSVTINGEQYNCAYMGTLALGDSWLIERTHVYQYCRRFKDGGGLYSFTRDDFGGTSSNGIIRDCIVHDGIGSADGIANFSGSFVVASVYMDSGSRNWEIDGCTLYNNPWAGVFCNNYTDQTRIHDCLIANNPIQVIFYETPTFSSSWPTTTNNYKNELNSNILVSYQSQLAIWTLSTGASANANYNPYTTGGSADNNYYVTPHKVTTTLAIGRHSTSLVSGFTTVTFAGWQTRNSADASSVLKGFYLEYTNAAQAKPEIVIATNPTAGSVLYELDDNVYQNEAGTNINDITIPAWGGKLAIVRGDYYHLLDGFTATTGTSISGRAPIVGNTPNITGGTHQVTSNQMVTTGGSGLIVWELVGSPNDYIFEYLTSCSNLSAVMRADVRMTDNIGSTTHRIIVDFTATDLQVREYDGSATPNNTWTAAFTRTTSTQYRIRIECLGTSIKVYIGGVLYIDEVTTVTTGDFVSVFGQTTRSTDFVVVYPNP